MGNRKNFERIITKSKQDELVSEAICTGIRKMVRFPKIYDQAMAVLVAIEDAGFKIVKDPRKKNGFMRVVGDPPDPCLCGDYGPHPGCDLPVEGKDCIVGFYDNNMNYIGSIKVPYSAILDGKITLGI